MTKKWGEKTREKFFPETHLNREFYRWKKSSGKSAKTRFFYKHLNIVTKNGGKKAGKKNFQNHRFRKETMMEKNRLERVENTFFINTRIS